MEKKLYSEEEIQNSRARVKAITECIEKNCLKEKMVIQWSTEYQRYLVSVSDLPGCMADGKTREEAIANAETVIGEWIETAKMLGRI